MFYNFFVVDEVKLFLQSEGVAMEACEFWWEFFRNPDACRFVLQNHDEAKSSSVLSLLIPALISRFVLTIEQVVVFIAFNV